MGAFFIKLPFINPFFAYIASSIYPVEPRESPLSQRVHDSIKISRILSDNIGNLLDINMGNIVKTGWLFGYVMPETPSRRRN